MKAADEDEDKEHMRSMYFEEQCADAETQIDQFYKKCDVQMQFSDEEECAKENDRNIRNSHCRTYSMDAQNLASSEIRNASCVDAETMIDQISKKCNLKMQLSDEQVCSNENDQEYSCYEEETSENSHYGTYSMDAQNLATSEIRNASTDDQQSA
ncbi:hypothetical protein RND71_024624 [Anisodus tanguticus]|uniref:Uncharacterized protein n=1 Tax=Anisodus tanguticus TaxID=243964 RepID=A0AAE1RRK7_9SOLA|nr:hypothetical protein RND71_024624 [Anisodus tanguticus]